MALVHCLLGTESHNRRWGSGKTKTIPTPNSKVWENCLLGNQPLVTKKIGHSQSIHFVLSVAPLIVPKYLQQSQVLQRLCSEVEKEPSLLCVSFEKWEPLSHKPPEDLSHLTGKSCFMYLYLTTNHQRGEGTKEDEMVGWHHWLSGHEFEQTLRDGEG